MQNKNNNDLSVEPADLADCLKIYYEEVIKRTGTEIALSAVLAAANQIISAHCAPGVGERFNEKVIQHLQGAAAQVPQMSKDKQAFGALTVDAARKQLSTIASKLRLAVSNPSGGTN